MANVNMTQELCAARCSRLGFALMGVEQGDQCYCGHDYQYTPTVLPMAECDTPCVGAKNESCGGTNRLLVFKAECTGPIAPNGYACLDPVSRALPFCNTTLTLDRRLDNLISLLTLEEQMAMIGCDTVHSIVDFCNCMTQGVERLGIPDYMICVEVNSAVATDCPAPEKCATVYASPANLAASFNRTIWTLKGEATAMEFRAFNNLNWYRAYQIPFAFVGLLGFGPNINIVRDPRFGRNSELPSEDPFLAGSYAVGFVNGMQYGPDKRYLKMIAGLKHYACYSVEDGRFYRSFNVSMFDLWDTYLPQFEMGFLADQGNAQAVMCSYAGVNGVPSCANDYLLNQVLREKWGRPDVLIATDYEAIYNMVMYSHYANNNSDAAAKSINSGSDINLGQNFYAPEQNGGNGGLLQAIQEGLTSDFAVAASARRALEKRFLTGQFDPLATQTYTQTGLEVINTTATFEFNLDATLQGLVLLKNANKTLPFSVGKKLAVVGPHVISQRDLMEDYSGDQQCFGGDDDYCVRTIGEVFTNFNGPENTRAEIGVDMDSQNATGIPAALEAVEWADIVVLCIGIGFQQEHEGIDRNNTLLPGLQEYFSLKVLALNKPTVIVLINGGIVSIDNLVAPASAIIEAFYPSMRGAEALFLSIFGMANRWGRLPVTIYPANFTTETDMYSFNMTAPPGRTYKYYTETPLFEFGAGLSYSTFAYHCGASVASNGTDITVDYKNMGPLSGDDVFLVFHRVSQTITESVNHPVPFRALVEFDRVSVEEGAGGSVSLSVPWSRFALTDNSGNKVLYSGTHYLDVTDSISAPCTITYNCDANANTCAVESQ
eukprot:Phypoly_transcript_02962.p1 GENE.Phypoly_transcript_02962~~Phypoly_transcript_02962.p1  ORF type:complete len:862 (+),score=98.40 Phypoly_transcript_02962:97-2586(+)